MTGLIFIWYTVIKKYERDKGQPVMVMPNLRRMTKKKLGEILLSEGVISPTHLEKALAAQKSSSKLLGEILIAQEACTEKDIAETIATQFSFPYISTSQYHISMDIAKLIPTSMMEEYLFVPVDRFNNILTIAIAGFLNDEILKEIEGKTQCQVQVFVTTISDIKERVKQISRNIEREEAVTAAGTTDESEAALAMGTEATAPLSGQTRSGDVRLKDKASIGARKRKGDALPAPELSDEEIIHQLEKNLEK